MAMSRTRTTIHAVCAEARARVQKIRDESLTKAKAKADKAAQTIKQERNVEQNYDASKPSGIASNKAKL